MLRDTSHNQPAVEVRKRLWRGALLTMYTCGLLAVWLCGSVAQADRVLLFRGTSTRLNGDYAGEVWAGSEVVVRLRATSGKQALARSREVSERLTELALQGLRADDLTVQMAGGVSRLVAKSETIVTADARTVAASGMSGANLCESWRKRLAGAVREPYLTVDCGESVLVPYGETRAFRYGATVAGDVLVASLADEVVLAEAPVPGRVVLRGVGVGKTAVSLEVGDLNHLVIVEVKRWAARINDHVVAQMRGTAIEDDMGRTAAANAALAGASGEPGSAVRILSLLSVGAGYLAKVSAHGPGYIALTRDVTVNIVGGLAPIPEAERLLVSNYPEKVSAPQTLMRQRLTAGVPVRLYWHHVNVSAEALRFEARIVNAGGEPARLRAAWSQSGPGVDEVFVGFTAMRRFWETIAAERLVGMRVPPGSVAMTAELAARPGRIVSGVMHVIADAGEDLYAELVAAPGSVQWQAIMPMGQIPAGGLYLSSYDFDATRSLGMEYAVGGPFAHATIGRDAVVNKEGFRLDGAYGVMHSVVIETSNPTEKRARVEVVVRAGGGVGRVIARVDGTLVYTHLLGVGQEEVLVHYSLMPGQSRTIRMKIMPVAGSNLPNTLIVRAVPVG